MKMNRVWRGIAALILFVAPSFANAGSFTLTNITPAQFEAITQELSSNFYYTTVSGASSLGKVWGFEFGLVGGVSDIPDIHQFVFNADNSTSLKETFYHGNILARVTTPFYGLTAEAAFIPSVAASDAKFSQYGGSILWTITDVFMTDLPVSLGTRVYYKKTNFEYAQTISSVPSTVTLDTSVKGINAVVSKNFGIVEPYAVFGYVKANGDLEVTSSNSTVQSILASGASTGSSDSSSMQMIGGVDFQLAFFSLGAEAARSFGKNSYTGRLSFRF
jgi:hypothetical protein